ncbi:ABC transporter substrate-binding protein [Sphingomicrobium marinum]|uniref:ABC transporter substrate-binding protein n=1 Tax=Sphingomicrobium marinum TaxID=1227950 RepID=UPI00224059F3|nr:ABC transporter substrate-binding protein [Sphingomicrobium marinum]
MSGFASLLSSSLKIASLDLCADEYLLMFAAPDQVASVSFLSRDEAESPLAAKAQAFPANDGTVESVVRHRPDIFLTTRSLGGAPAQIADRMGMRVVTLPYADSPRAVAKNVRMVTSLTGRHNAASQWQQRLSRLVTNAPSQRRSTLVISAGGLGVGPATDSWLGYAGLDAIASRPGLSFVEQIALARPDIILQSRYRADQYSRNTEWQRHPLTRRLAGQRITVDGRAWTCSGPLMLGEIERLQQR